MSLVLPKEEKSTTARQAVRPAIGGPSLRKRIG
ncbi:hypothetical protein PAQ31011_01494 [Pandoraea aquatica]|uniref:Uncharacterized protein n=1 Tax=Pandoraea aquatica TaxID=2508290 RepID=A0A5E4TK12_9BURK|nr:hypothetical protein PAQ31011_01494 [Pandoraea aquatica]